MSVLAGILTGRPTFHLHPLHPRGILLPMQVFPTFTNLYVPQPSRPYDVQPFDYLGDPALMRIAQLEERLASLERLQPRVECRQGFSPEFLWTVS